MWPKPAATTTSAANWDESEESEDEHQEQASTQKGPQQPQNNWDESEPDTDDNEEKTRNEILNMLNISVRSRNVVRIIVGNEVLLRRDIPVKKLIKYLDMARTQTDIPVSTAEPPHIWKKYPKLVDHVDYIAVHLLPYWEGVPLEEAVDFVVNNINELKQLYPDKPIVIGEVGWPSNGRSIKAAAASEANEATFLRRFLARAADEVWSHREVILNPHYKDMGNLYGSEYWSYLLPRRVGETISKALTENRLPIGALTAKQLGIIDDHFAADPEEFRQRIVHIAEETAKHGDYSQKLARKHRLSRLRFWLTGVKRAQSGAVATFVRATRF